MAKNPKKRNCPALGKMIKRDDCGENRVSRYSCPDDCEFNPFGSENYTDFLELEEKFDEFMVERLKHEPVLDPEIRQALVRAETHPQPDVLLNDVFIRNIYCTPLADGRTVAQTCLEEVELKNDMRILLQSKQATRVALLEIRDVLDEQTLRAVDLLRPESAPLTICDRSWAKRAVRYDLGITWCHTLPHFTRVAGVVTEWTHFDLEPVEALLKLAQHLGGPAELGEPLNQWLLANMEPVNSATHDAAYERQRLIYDRMDSMFCRTTYQSETDSEELIGRLVMEPETDDGEDLSDEETAQGFTRIWDWFEPAGAGDAMFGNKARTLLGRILLNRDGRWRVEAFGEVRSLRLKAAFEHCMEDKVTFSSERKDNVAAKTLGDHKPLTADALKRVPPEFLENLPGIDMSQSRIAVDLEAGKANTLLEMRQNHLRSWVDESIPKLGNATPREAARDPEKRPLLLRLVKEMIRGLDQAALAEGEVVDIDWIYAELKLEEIRAKRPPKRKKRHAQQFEGPALNRPVLPPIPARELTEIGEVYEIEDSVFEFLESGDSDVARSMMTPNCVTVMGAVRELVAGNDEDAIDASLDLAQLLTPFVIMLLGTSELFEIELGVEELRAEFERQLSQMCKLSAESEEKGDTSHFEVWYQSCSQPRLLELVLVRLTDYEEEVPGAFNEESFFPADHVLCLAAALINLLCQKLSRVPR